MQKKKKENAIHLIISNRPFSINKVTLIRFEIVFYGRFNFAMLSAHSAHTHTHTHAPVCLPVSHTFTTHLSHRAHSHSECCLRCMLCVCFGL